MTAAGSTPSLPIGESIRRGWQAFARSPWGFVGFTLLGLVLTFFTQWLQDVGSNGGDSEGFGAIGWGLVVVSGWCSMCWSACG